MSLDPILRSTDPQSARHGAGQETVAVVIPCLNEGTTIGRVVSAFRAQLPLARIVVVDNGSDDDTRAEARRVGAEVISESRRGKGYALVRGFQATREAAHVIIVDGDDTYPAEDVAKLIAEVEQGADMAIGTRLVSCEVGAISRSHSIGNRLFIWIVRLLFGVRTEDLFSGYRVFTRRFLDQIALLAPGFEIETELSMQALAHGFRVAEVPVKYRARPARSVSKLNAARDGYRILIALIAFFRDYRPLTFFAVLASLFFAASLLAGIPVVSDYVRTGLVPRMPLALLAVGLAVLGAMALIGGVILSSINRRAAELAALVARRYGP